MSSLSRCTYIHQTQVSFIELAAAAACETGEGGGVAGQQVRLIRAMKPFKIARLLKLGKSAAVITVLMDYYEISPKQGKTLQVSGAGFAQQRLAYRCSKMCCLVWVGPEPSLDRRRAHDVQIHLKTGDGLVGGCGAYIRMHHLAWEGCWRRDRPEAGNRIVSRNDTLGQHRSAL